MAFSGWPYFEHQFLRAAELPITRHNTYFLHLWNGYRNTSCTRNPIDLSDDVAGSTRCAALPSGKHARNYATHQDAATAFADAIATGDYPDLHEALKSGDPGSYKNQAGIALNLQRWGSTRYQKEWDTLASLGTPPGSTSTGAPTPQSKDVSGAWHRLMRTFAEDGRRTIVELRKSTAALTRIERQLRRM